MYKLTKTFLHLWLALVSVVAFGFGWAFIAHAQKPAPLVEPQVQAVSPAQPVLEAVPSLDDYLNDEILQSPMIQSSDIQLPRLRTGGS